MLRIKRPFSKRYIYPRHRGQASNEPKQFKTGPAGGGSKNGLFINERVFCTLPSLHLVARGQIVYLYCVRYRVEVILGEAFFMEYPVPNNNLPTK